jgi:cytochrome c-type biogenesis protein CcmF
MWQSLPELGTATLYAVLVVAGYTFAVALAAGRGQPRLLQSARLGAYATSTLIGLGVALLAYAFITHDFRITYVAHYSDRSMTTAYLLTALWGGQDGSLLWWTALLAVYVAGCVRWLGGRYRELQPYVIATLMVVVGFFAMLMLFTANPFAVNISGVVPDGQGLNPQLQNYWMIIHPPALYSGFVGCTIPMAFAVAAMVTGRLDSEWIVAVRKWMLLAWLLLSIGNVLGMVWAYEMLGWGGFWAWDPVENASALPWFTTTAYVHSTMIQERRGMFKVWNVVLILLSFFLTIFGTFLTRSGLISSVHAFAQSDIGIYFVGAMAVIIAASVALVVWRLPLLRGENRIETIASREAMFVANNWALLGAAVFVAVVTLLPKLTEWLSKEVITVGPPFYNRWMAPIGLLVFALMGMAPLFAWRKTSHASIRAAFKWPLVVTAVVTALHLLLGKRYGIPAYVSVSDPYPGVLGTLVQSFEVIAPGLTISLLGFNIAVVVQEFWVGWRSRITSTRLNGSPESGLVALFNLVTKSRRRYGGYIVHVGIACAYLGFVGATWSVTQEVPLAEGESAQVGGYRLTYLSTRMCPGNPACSPVEQADITKRMILSDVRVSDSAGREVALLTPGKHIYNRMPDSPVTAVAIDRGLRHDLYVVTGSVDPKTKHATFQVHINAFVSWIWLGLLLLISGAAVSLWPDLDRSRVGAWAWVRSSVAVGASAVFGLILASSVLNPSTQLSRPTPAVTRQQEAKVMGASGWTAALGTPLLGYAIGLGATRRRRNRRSTETTTNSEETNR